MCSARLGHSDIADKQMSVTTTGESDKNFAQWLHDWLNHKNFPFGVNITINILATRDVYMSYRTAKLQKLHFNISKLNGHMMHQQSLFVIR